jgi:hypothetical protein
VVNTKLYKIKYRRVGFWAWLIPSFYPDGKTFIEDETAYKAMDKFHKDCSRDTYEIIDITGVK